MQLRTSGHVARTAPRAFEVLRGGRHFYGIVKDAPHVQVFLNLTTARIAVAPKPTARSSQVPNRDRSRHFVASCARRLAPARFRDVIPGLVDRADQIFIAGTARGPIAPIVFAYLDD